MYSLPVPKFFANDPKTQMTLSLMNSFVHSGRSRLLMLTQIFFASKNLLAVLASKKLNNH